MLKISTNAKVSTAVAPFLPPVHSRIREITGLTARVINRMSSNDNKTGDNNEKVFTKMNNPAASRI